MQSIVIRAATPADAPALRRLAALDSQRPLEGMVLVGEAGGVIRAAVGVTDGRTIADPFHPTAELVAFLRLRAGSMQEAGAASRRPRLPRLPHLPTRRPHTALSS